MKDSPLQRFIDSLFYHNQEVATRANTGWQARVLHTTTATPPLSINEGDDHRVLLHCHAGCTPDAICDAIGIEMADLFPTPDEVGRTRHAKPGNGRPAGRTFATANEAVKALELQHGKRSEIWTYTDSNGTPVGAIVRWDTSAGKEIRPVSRNSHGWIIGGMAEPEAALSPAGSCRCRPRVYRRGREVRRGSTIHRTGSHDVAARKQERLQKPTGRHWRAKMSSFCRTMMRLAGATRTR